MKQKIRDVEKSLRMSISDIFNSTFNGVTVTGIIIYFQIKR
jgi:translation elongation factor EF-Tu-like GTPase